MHGRECSLWSSNQYNLYSVAFGPYFVTCTTSIHTVWEVPSRNPATLGTHVVIELEVIEAWALVECTSLQFELRALKGYRRICGNCDIIWNFTKA
jgi:hypothetical protein